MHRILTTVLVAGAMVCPSIAAAQSGSSAPAPKAGFSRVWVDVNVGITNAAAKSFTLDTAQIIYGETATASTAYTLGTGLTIDGGGGFMFLKKLGVGVNVSSTAYPGDVATLSIRIPHPYYYSAFATDSHVTDNALVRAELGIHIQAMFVPVDNGKVRVRIFGGPSRLSVKQTVVDDFFYSQTYSLYTTYNVVNIMSTSTSDTTASVFGFNVGGDVSVFFNRVIGVGGFARFVRGSVDIDNPLGGSPSTVTLKLGGIQAGGGLRLRF